jgi:hypothetical protein
MTDGQLNDLFGACLEALRFIEGRLADAPVLAEAATEIAARGAEAQDAGAGQKMIQRFLFDGIDGKSGGCAVAQGIELAADVLADVAKAGLAVAQTTEARAQGAEDPAIFLSLPPKGLFHMKNYLAFSGLLQGGKSIAAHNLFLLTVI